MRMEAPPPIFTNNNYTTLTNMHAQYEMIPCSGFKEVQSMDADADARQNPFRRLANTSICF